MANADHPRASVHEPVLLHEIVNAFKPSETESGAKGIPWYLDGTLGGAGHALALAKACGGKINILGFDRDIRAVERARSILEGHAEKIILVNEDFRDLDQVMELHGIPNADMILLDLGVSTDELESSGRGFSFRKDEPLFMTYDGPDEYPFTARDIVNRWDEAVLADVIFGYGEERYARRIAKAIVSYRTKKPIETSGELAEIVKTSVPPLYRRGRIHPATRTFQALRIAVNDELNALKEGLAKGYERLARDGKMAVISFHSLEDRIVKEFFKNESKKGAQLVTKKPIRPSFEEIGRNAKARSAKLRIIQKAIHNE